MPDRFTNAIGATSVSISGTGFFATAGGFIEGNAAAIMAVCAVVSTAVTVWSRIRSRE